MDKLRPYKLNTIVTGDCLEIMGQMPDRCVDLEFWDPPYNKGKADWDKGHDWHIWVAEAVRVLKFNGALWVIHDDPRELVAISRYIVEVGGPALINWITWDKFKWAYVRKFQDAGTRSFIDVNEYLIYHADDGKGQLNERRGGFIFESLRAYLDTERQKADKSIIQIRDEMGFRGNMPFHWFARGLRKGRKSQWQLPIREHYEVLQRLCVPYMNRNYMDLHSEYESLRRTFNNPERLSSIWQGPPARPNNHETPKPEWLLERIIATTTKPGDTVADFFMGSGTTAVAADCLGRNFFGCDINPEYVEMALKRLEKDKTGRAQLKMTI